MSDIGDIKDLEKELAFSKETISDDLIKQPSTWYYYASLYDRLMHELNTAQLRLEVYAAELSAKIETTYKEETKPQPDAKGRAKFSQAGCDSRIKLGIPRDPTWLQLSQAIAILKYRAKLAYSAKGALTQKGDMLRAYVSILRQEYDNSAIPK